LRRALERTGAAAAVLAVVLAGCGSTPKSRYVAKLNAMCEDFAKKELKIGTPATPAELGTRGERIVAAYEQAIVRPIESLEAPPAIASQAAQLRGLARRQLNVLSALASAGKAGDLQRVRRLSTVNQQVNAQAAEVARNLKADSCAS
jgi:hypothetical protein